ncbi:uncharacterized protein TNCV_2423031 [Trichonephila clavipes]|nr:uncharacterized protein TNCV_2423031 [Trichonephila clavipes]
MSARFSDPGVREGILTSHCSATRGLLATDHVILNHGHVTWTTPELTPPLLTTTPHQRENVSALDRFSVHHCPTWRVFSGTGLELVAKPATIRYLHHSATEGTSAPRNLPCRIADVILHYSRVTKMACELALRTSTPRQRGDFEIRQI